MRFLILFLALAAMPLVAADDLPIMPPSGLTGSYDEANQTLHLRWSAPESGDFMYHVYRDGALLGNATNTTFTDAVDAQAHIYTVTAENGEDESPPSNPYIFANTPDPFSVTGNRCEPIGVIIDDDPPAVDPVIRWECVPGIPIEQNVIALRSGN